MKLLPKKSNSLNKSLKNTKQALTLFKDALKTDPKLLKNSPLFLKMLNPLLNLFLKLKISFQKYNLFRLFPLQLTFKHPLPNLFSLKIKDSKSLLNQNLLQQQNLYRNLELFKQNQSILSMLTSQLHLKKLLKPTPPRFSISPYNKNQVLRLIKLSLRMSKNLMILMMI